MGEKLAAREGKLKACSARNSELWFESPPTSRNVSRNAIPIPASADRNEVFNGHSFVTYEVAWRSSSERPIPRQMFGFTNGTSCYVFPSARGQHGEKLELDTLAPRLGRITYRRRSKTSVPYSNSFRAKDLRSL